MSLMNRTVCQLSYLNFFLSPFGEIKVLIIEKLLASKFI